MLLKLLCDFIHAIFGTQLCMVLKIGEFVK